MSIVGFVGTNFNGKLGLYMALSSLSIYICMHVHTLHCIYDFIQLFQLYSSWSTITTMLHSDKKQGLGVVGFREHWAVIWVHNGRDPTHLTLKQFGMVETSVDRSWPPMDCSDHWKGLPVHSSARLRISAAAAPLPRRFLRCCPGTAYAGCFFGAEGCLKGSWNCAKVRRIYGYSGIELVKMTSKK